MQTSETTENQLEIFSIDLKESRVECCDLYGLKYFDYSYDIQQELEECVEGGVVVSSGFVYYPINIMVYQYAKDEEGNYISYYLSRADREHIIDYIYNPLYDELNNIR